ncbi:hypothetical protein FRB95_006492 [Tulasnella sp. JGI-2019a]|nr:hypothetical protein FRB95_006492 [Tulasnella sp. JGI-2019a]
MSNMNSNVPLRWLSRSTHHLITLAVEGSPGNISPQLTLDPPEKPSVVAGLAIPVDSKLIRICSQPNSNIPVDPSGMFSLTSWTLNKFPSPSAMGRPLGTSSARRDDCGTQSPHVLRKATARGLHFTS